MGAWDQVRSQLCTKRASPSDNKRMSMHRDFSAAIRAGDIDRAESLFVELPAPIPDHLLRSVADLHMAQHRWDNAAHTLARLKARNVDEEMIRKLCAILAALKVHRAAVYRALIDAAPDAR